jgi:hypothetical protein
MIIMIIIIIMESAIVRGSSCILLRVTLCSACSECVLCLCALSPDFSLSASSLFRLSRALFCAVTSSSLFAMSGGALEVIELRSIEVTMLSTLITFRSFLYSLYC